MALTCELCNSTNFVKQEGLFVCQDCGMKYSIEEAKRLMSGEAAPAAPAAAAGGVQDRIANFLTLARNAFDSSNNQEAESYASRILELDPCHAEAWLIKGEAIGWQSTVSNVRFDEMTNCWQHCVENASPEDITGFREIMKDQATRLIRALVSVNAENFGKFPSKENRDRLKGCGQTALDTAKSLIALWAPLKLAEVSQNMAEQMNTAAVTGSDKADADYGPDRSDKNIYAYRRWIEETDYCIDILEVALIFAEKEATINQIVKNLTILQENVIKSCCYKFEATGYSSGYVEDQSLTETAKSIRRRSIQKYKNDAAAKIKEKKDKEEKKRREEQEKRNKEYWDAHADEKAQMEARLAELGEAKKPLEAQIAELDKKITAILKHRDDPVPAAEKIKKLKQLIDEKYAYKAKLGIFKGKEKKAIAEELVVLEGDMIQLRKELEQETKAQQAKVDAEAAPLMKELRELRNQLKVITDEIDSIKKELSKNR